VQDVLRILSDSSLFTDELGSVLLYKHIQKMGASRHESFGDAKGMGEGGETLHASAAAQINPVGADAGAGVSADVQAPRWRRFR